jgi:asparagine synthase (glutamine-hydrolysing)
MIQIQQHRGPDDRGVWLDKERPLALGHCRLSILDLSDAGKQPMVSDSHRFILVFNGEVYNCQQIKIELQKELGEIPWRGRSDTEVLLRAVEYWGVETAVEHLNGMFAFACWDRKKKALYLVRDRLGKKPLYYGWNSSCFVFSSELKGIIAGIETFSVNRKALPFLLKHNFIPSPHSILKGIYKLPAGAMVVLPLERLRSQRDFSPFPRKERVIGMPYYYWHLKAIITESWKRQLTTSFEQIASDVEKLLFDSVALRMEADVPVGAFLSGGIDSSLVTALMQAQSRESVKTFSIGFQGEGNEAVFAGKVAQHLGTDHTELYITPELLVQQIPRLPEISDEPVGDTAVLPTFFVSRLAKRDVTVVLSGDGGDELFAGYPRYIWTKEYWQRARSRVAWMPPLLRKIVMRAIRELPANVLRAFPYGFRLNEMAATLYYETPEDVYHSLIDHWQEGIRSTLGNEPVWSVLTTPNDWPKNFDPVQQMVYLDLAARLPDSIVSKVDRASMQLSLETRCPLMDYRLVELAMKIPTDMKINRGQGKWMLRQLLYRYVPKELVDRPKKGFKMPISDWLRGPLREWAADLLSERKIVNDGYFKPELIMKKWQEHLSGQKDWHYDLWNVLMFQAWLDHYRN